MKIVKSQLHWIGHTAQWKRDAFRILWEISCKANMFEESEGDEVYRL
jgi:hypothetical protein